MIWNSDGWSMPFSTLLVALVVIIICVVILIVRC